MNTLAVILVLAILVLVPLFLFAGKRIKLAISNFFEEMRQEEQKIAQLYSEFKENPSSITDEELSEMFEYYFHMETLLPINHLEFHCMPSHSFLNGLSGKSWEIFSELSRRRKSATLVQA